VGDVAKNQATINPENTVFDVKRLIGHDYANKLVQTDKKLVMSLSLTCEEAPLVSTAE
jgi:heat shock protein 5